MKRVSLSLLMVCAASFYVSMAFAGEAVSMNKEEALIKARPFVDAKIEQSFASMQCPNLVGVPLAILKLCFEEIVEEDGSINYDWFSSMSQRLSKKGVTMLLDDAVAKSFNGNVLKKPSVSSSILLLKGGKTLSVELGPRGNVACIGDPSSLSTQDSGVMESENLKATLSEQAIPSAKLVTE